MLLKIIIFLTIFVKISGPVLSKRNVSPLDAQLRLNNYLQGIMKIKLNVRVNLTSSGQLFSVWPKFHSEAESAEGRKTAD